MANENLTYNLNFNADTSSIKGVRDQIRLLQVAMQEAGKAGNDALYNKIGAKIGELKNDMGDLALKMKSADPGEMLANVGKLASGLVGAFSGVQAGIALIAGENKNMQAIMTKSLLMIQLLQGAEQVRAMLEGKGLIAGMALQVKNLALKSGIVVMTQAQTVATEEATVAQLALNTAALANPYVLLGAAIAAIVAGLVAWVVVAGQETEQEKKLRIEKEETLKVTNEAADAASKELTSITIMIDEIGKETTSRKKRKDLIEEIKKDYPGYLSKMDEERLLVGDTTAAYDKLKEAIYQKAVVAAYQTQLTEKIALEMKAQEALNVRKEEEAVALEKINKQYNIQEGQLNSNIYAIQQINAQQEETNKYIKAYNDASNETQKVLNKVSTEQQALTNLVGDHADKLDKTTKSVKKLTTEFDEYYKKLKEEKDKQLAAIPKDDELIRMSGIITPLMLDKVLQENQDRRLKSLEENKKFRQKELQNTIDALNKQREEELKNSELSGQERLDIEARYSGMIKKVKIKDAEETKKKQDELNKLTVEGFAKLTGGIKDLLIQDMNNRINAAEGNAAEQKRIRDEYQASIKTAAIAEATINGALGVTSIWSTWAEVPVVAALLTALEVAAVAVQISTISQQQFAKGGFLNGPSHINGGINTPFGQLEGGEFVSSKRTTTRFAPVLEAMNNAGNNNQPVQLIDYDLLASKINDKRVIIVSSEMSAQQSRDKRIEQRAKF